MEDFLLPNTFYIPKEVNKSEIDYQGQWNIYDGATQNNTVILVLNNQTNNVDGHIDINLVKDYQDESYEDEETGEWVEQITPSSFENLLFDINIINNKYIVSYHNYSNDQFDPVISYEDVTINDKEYFKITINNESGDYTFDNYYVEHNNTQGISDNEVKDFIFEFIKTNLENEIESPGSTPELAPQIVEIKQTYSDIADTIRELSGTEDTIKMSDLPKILPKLLDGTYTGKDSIDEEE